MDTAAWRHLLRPGSSSRFASSGAAGPFILHGTHDSLASTAAARLSATRLRSASPNPVVYAELQRAMESVHAVTRFLESMHAGTRAIDDAVPRRH